MAAGPILAGFVHDYLGGINATFYFAAGVGIIGAVIFGWFGYREEKVVPDTV
jgi:cyanate permease